jgi:hypothetical protein
MPAREQIATGHESIYVSFSDEAESPCLELKVCRIALPNQHGNPQDARWGIVPGCHPSEDDIYRWIEQLIVADPTTGFEPEMDRLLVSFVRQPQAGLQAKWHSPLSDLLAMRCMWKVWSCKQLFWRRHPKSPATAFNFRASLIHDALRLFAAQALSERERKLLGEVHALFFPKKEEKETDGANIVKWLLLWQMILVYRQSLIWMLAQEKQMPLGGKSIATRSATLEMLTENISRAREPEKARVPKGDRAAVRSRHCHILWILPEKHKVGEDPERGPGDLWERRRQFPISESLGGTTRLP